VVQVADRRARLTPEDLERLVLLEELAGVELFDPAYQGIGRGLVAARAHRLANEAARDFLGAARHFALATSGRRRAPRRGSCGSAARPRGTRGPSRCPRRRSAAWPDRRRT